MKIGTGWLGWTEQETDNTSIDVIVGGYEAKLEMLRWAHDKPAPEVVHRAVTPPAGTKMTPALVMAMFGNNRK